MLHKFLDPKNDVAFKKIFGTEKNKDILIHFLNDMVVFKEGAKIKDVSFLKTLQDPETAALKSSIVDILCRDENENTYIVEMQVAKEKGFEKRAQYYASKAYISQANSGGEYRDLKEVIFLAISDYIMFPNKPDYKSDHVILDKKSYENDLKDFSFTFLELPKFKKEIDQLSNMTEKWAYFFKHAEDTKEQDLNKLVNQNPILERAYEELNRFSWNEVELLTYDQAEKYAWAHRASMDQKFDEGEAKGRAEGEAKGRAEGEAKGRAEGRAEGKKEGERAAFHKFVESMLKNGYEIENIAELTGLNIEEIKSQNFQKKE